VDPVDRSRLDPVYFSHSSSLLRVPSLGVPAPIFARRTALIAAVLSRAYYLAGPPHRFCSADEFRPADPLRGDSPQDIVPISSIADFFADIFDIFRLWSNNPLNGELDWSTRKSYGSTLKNYQKFKEFPRYGGENTYGQITSVKISKGRSLPRGRRAET